MAVNAQSLKFILGLKLKKFRLQQNLSLKELAALTGLSISFLSEIEKGKKYPKPEKLVQLAQGLGVGFDELVSLKVDKDLAQVTSLLDSPFLREFPFELFGMTQRDLVELMTNSPNRAGAFIRTFLEIGQTYDMQVEHFLLAALRSYQQLHSNYFEEIEEEVARFVAERGWKGRATISFAELKAFFVKEHGADVEESSFEDYSTLRTLRSIWVEGKRPKLVINRKLLPSQKAFLLGREIGFNYLGLKERSVTSSWIKVESFDQVLNNFKAAYFAGALAINREQLRKDLAGFFKKKSWNSSFFLEMMQRYDATPEMFLYRLSQLIPRLFGLNEIFYMRFNHRVGSDDFRMTKDLNMTNGVVPHGIGLNEHYCRRWQAISLLKQLSSQQQEQGSQGVLVSAQISHFLESGTEFFLITLARPLALKQATNSSITLGFLMSDAFRALVKFWRDEAISHVEVNETCERCGLSEEQCQDRVAHPYIFAKQQKQMQRQNELQEYLQARAGD